MILIIDMNSSSLGFYEFVLPVVSIVRKSTGCRTRHYSELTLKEVNKYSGLILSGTPLKDREYIKNIERLFWIRKCACPILGICAGMQVIALVFNSSLKECKEIGMTDIRTVKENPLLPSRFKAYELHNYGVASSGEFEVIARSKKCIQGIKHKRKEIYGLLFHPEVRNKEIINRFVVRTLQNSHPI